MKISSFFVSVLFSLIVVADSSSVAPKADELTCIKDSDCLLASNSCNGCCERAAIAKISLKQFQARVAECGKKWKGPQCECDKSGLTVTCENKMCVAKSRTK